MSLSTIEEEYIGASKASQESLWIIRLLQEAHHQQDHPTTIFCDNQSTIKLAKNPIYRAKSKHIEVHHHFVRDLMESEVVDLHFYSSEDQIADIFTNVLSTVKFLKFRTLLYLKEVDV